MIPLLLLCSLSLSFAQALPLSPRTGRCIFGGGVLSYVGDTSDLRVEEEEQLNTLRVSNIRGLLSGDLSLFSEKFSSDKPNRSSWISFSFFSLQGC
ncbi:hypothetical protein F7725_014997 [Dissostichus mawsoni]|uniref:Secreted protein n=1 Tax=Dissostichus mawsoni TaxID=36200 RepID=A0A7J5YGI5_DISMA|nr:hypothetical protein F7725_014997 [Dissostichus mawsoni]